MIPIVLMVVALAGLLYGSELAVDGMRTLAARLGRSPLTVGLTIAAVGTSLPEMATNVAAALTDAPEHGSGIAVGNIVGSCLSQITLLLGLTALVRPLHAPWSELRRDGIAALAALSLMALVMADGVASRWEGIALVLVYVAYLAHVWRRVGPADAATPSPPPSAARGALLKSLVGTAVLVLSADLLVDTGVRIAIDMGVDENKVGLAVGVATGIPELAFALQGVRHGAPGLAIGNLIGSNVTDPLASFGLGASIRAVEVAPEVLRIDTPVWAVSTVLALFLLSRPAGLGRAGGAFLVAAFLVYSVARGAL